MRHGVRSGRHLGSALLRYRSTSLAPSAFLAVEHTKWWLCSMLVSDDKVMHNTVCSSRLQLLWHDANVLLSRLC